MEGTQPVLKGDVLRYMLRFCDERTLRAAAGVCEEWRRQALDHRLAHLWKSAFEERLTCADELVLLGSVGRTMEACASEPVALKIDGSPYLAALEARGTLRIWRPFGTGKTQLLGTWPRLVPLEGCALRSCGGIIASGAGDPCLRVWCRGAKGRFVYPYGKDVPLTHVEIDEEEGLVYALAAEHRIQLYSTSLALETEGPKASALFKVHWKDRPLIVHAVGDALHFGRRVFKGVLEGPITAVRVLPQGIGVLDKGGERFTCLDGQGKVLKRCNLGPCAPSDLISKEGLLPVSNGYRGHHKEPCITRWDSSVIEGLIPRQNRWWLSSKKIVAGVHVGEEFFLTVHACGRAVVWHLVQSPGMHRELTAAVVFDRTLMVPIHQLHFQKKLTHFKVIRTGSTPYWLVRFEDGSVDLFDPLDLKPFSGGSPVRKKRKTRR